MKIKRLYIGDVGIYRNALMEDISPNIVVIGGLNRAGKTTLLEVLKHLPYGFSRNLRDTRVEHSVEADLVSEEGENITLKLSGLKTPQVSTVDGKNIDYKDLYGDVDKFTYSKLYTITLDELRKSNNKGEEEKIKSILLGAGLSDIAVIPKITEDFRKEKERIGGKNGNPGTKLFKAHYEKLLSGVEEREQALKQVEEYKEKCQQMDKLVVEIQEQSMELDETEHALKLLDAVKANFSYFEEKKLLEAELSRYKDKDSYLRFQDFPPIEKVKLLSEEYTKNYDEYREAKSELETSSEEPSDYNKLMDNRDKLRSFEKSSSGLKQRLENYFSLRKQYERDKESLAIRLNDLNSDFRGDFLSILNINCDFIEEQKLLQLVEDINENEGSCKRITWEKEDLNAQKQRIINEMSNYGHSSLEQVIKSYLFISLGIILAGSILFIFNKTLGGAVALAGTAAAAIYAFIKKTSGNEQLVKQKALKIELNSIESKIENCSQRLDNAEKLFKKLQEKLEIYKKSVKLNRQVSPTAFYEYFKNLKQLRNDVVRLGYSGKNLESIYREIKGELLELSRLLKDIYSTEIVKEETLLEEQEKLFKLLETALIKLEKAERLSDLKAKLDSTKIKVHNVLKLDCEEQEILNEFDILIREYEAYNEYKSKETKLQVIKNIIDGNLGAVKEANKDNENNYDNLFNKYSSFEDASRSCKDVEAKRKTILDNLEELKERRQKLRIEIENLSTSDRLQKAQHIINSSRGELESLAVKYAVYSAAEYILEKVQKKFIESAKDALLSGAGQIFSSITSGEYKGIIPGENLLSSDFRTINAEQGEAAADILSRGTGEQLFLSVRLNRIKEISPKLPVVFDDAFVNFDSIHTKNTLNILSEISAENQLFILTCHPELVRLVSETSDRVQYWKLEKGSFQLSNADELIDYLGEKGR